MALMARLPPTTRQKLGTVSQWGAASSGADETNVGNANDHFNIVPNHTGDQEEEWMPALVDLFDDSAEQRSTAHDNPLDCVEHDTDKYDEPLGNAVGGVRHDDAHRDDHPSGDRDDQHHLPHVLCGGGQEVDDKQGSSSLSLPVRKEDHFDGVIDRAVVDSTSTTWAKMTLSSVPSMAE